MEHYLMNGMIMFEILVALVLGMWLLLGVMGLLLAAWWFNKGD